MHHVYFSSELHRQTVNVRKSITRAIDLLLSTHLPFKGERKAGRKKTNFLKVYFIFLSAEDVTLYLKYFSYKHSWVMRFLYSIWQRLYSPSPTPCPSLSTWPFYYTPLPVIITFGPASVTRVTSAEKKTRLGFFFLRLSVCSPWIQPFVCFQ